MKSFITTFFLSLFFLSAAYTQTLNVKKLDSLFDILQNRGLATGSVAISINGKIAYQKAIGFALLDSNKKIAPDIHTKYRIGSISKMFTSVIIFQLIEEGKLSLGTKLAAYFPQLPNANKITIKELLYHRSGLHDYTRDTNFPDWMDKPKTHEEMLKIIAGKSTDFEPGAKADYCNTNYLLLSYIIEKICQMPYAAAIEQRIVLRIGLANTYYGRTIDIHRNESASYKYADSSWNKVKETDISIHCGAGSIVSTPSDLIVFIHKLFNAKLVSRASLDRMKTIINGYGMGMFPYDFGTTKGYGHNGRIEEFYAAVRYYPQKKLAVSYITNGILYPRMDILEGILNICFNEAYAIPFSKSLALQRNGLGQYPGTYSSGDLPFRVVCKIDNDGLIFEAGGKIMEARPISTNYFMNAKTGSFFEFNPEKGELRIKETDNIYYLQREK